MQPPRSLRSPAGSSGRPCGRAALRASEQSLLGLQRWRLRWANQPGRPPQSHAMLKATLPGETAQDAADGVAWSRRVGRRGQARRPQARQSHHRDFAMSSSTARPVKGSRPAVFATRGQVQTRRHNGPSRRATPHCSPEGPTRSLPEPRASRLFHGSVSRVCFTGLFHFCHLQQR